MLIASCVVLIIAGILELMARTTLFGNKSIDEAPKESKKSKKKPKKPSENFESENKE